MREKVRLLKTAFGSEVAQEDWDYAKEWIGTVTFERTIWTPRHALLRSDGAVIEYIGQDYNANELKWLENGWTEDICELCEHKIKKGDSGWSPDGRHWLCIECYDLLCISNTPFSGGRGGHHNKYPPHIDTYYVSLTHHYSVLAAWMKKQILLSI